MPETRFRPEYLGSIFVLNRHSLDYAPANEAEFLKWAASYIANAATIAGQFPAVYGGSATYPLYLLTPLLTNINNSINDLNRLVDLVNSWRAYKNIQIYATEHKVSVPPPPPASPIIGTGVTTTATVGLMGMIDWQVRTLREQPGFNQTIAELLGIVPRPPGAVDPTQIYPNLRARNLGGNRVRLTWHSTASIRGITGAILRVNRGDGRWHDLATMITLGRFIDTTMQPVEPGVWTYALFYVDDTGGQIGQVSEVSITVSANAVVVRDENLNQHKA